LSTAIAEEACTLLMSEQQKQDLEALFAGHPVSEGLREKKDYRKPQERTSLPQWSWLQEEMKAFVDRESFLKEAQRRYVCAGVPVQRKVFTAFYPESRQYQEDGYPSHLPAPYHAALMHFPGAPYALPTDYLPMVQENAASQVQQEYKRLALLCHPDKHPRAVEEATERFKRLKAAKKCFDTYKDDERFWGQLRFFQEERERQAVRPQRKDYKNRCWGVL
jgi:hypothetical protein